MPETNLRDGAPLSITALTIVAILVVVLHVASGDLLGRSHAHASEAGQGGEASCQGDVTPPASALPFD